MVARRHFSSFCSCGLKNVAWGVGTCTGSITGVFLLSGTSAVKKSVSVTMFNYWVLILFLVLAVILEDAHVPFSNMVLSAFLPFVLDG